jgi:hypothetical protein
MKPECTPKASSLDQSKMSGALSAQESALEGIDAATDVQGIRDALDDAVNGAQEVQSEYEEALSTTPMLEEQVQPLIDALESWVSEMESADLEDIEADEVRDEAHVDTSELSDGHDCDACERQRETLLEERKDTARDAVNALEY